MSTGTSLVAFKQAFKAALAARPGLVGVQVAYEYPFDEVTGEDIWFGKSEANNTIPVMRAGTKKVQEDYTLRVFAQVLHTDGLGQEAADLRAVALLREVQQCLAENPQTTPEIQWAAIDGWEHSTGPYDGANTNRGSRFEIRVGVHARLGA